MYARLSKYVAVYNGYVPDDGSGVCYKRDTTCRRPTKATYTIDGVPLTGVPTSLSGGGQTVTAGGPPIIISGLTFSLPAFPGNGGIYVDGILTHLSTANATAMVSNSSSSTAMLQTTSSIPRATYGSLTSSTPSYPSSTTTWNVASYTGPSTVNSSR